LNSLNSLKSLETHFKPFQGVQATFKVILCFADAPPSVQWIDVVWEWRRKWPPYYGTVRTVRYGHGVHP
jgi:hypothetical protein